MKILISGSTGLVGSALIPFLKTQGHEIKRLLRLCSEIKSDAVVLDPIDEKSNLQKLEGFDVVINLAGENVAGRRWNDAVKEKILKSRVEGTALLCGLLEKLSNPPKVLLNASAVGYYGSQEDVWLTEGSKSGSGFLPDVCRQWEAAAETAERRGIRVVKMRIGTILSVKGGALKKMLTPFRLGLGGVIGSGSQYMSWISIDDLTASILHLIMHADVKGPVNIVTPNPVTNSEFTKTLGSELNRPTIFPMPAFAARLVLGEMADELLLSSQRVKPEILLRSGFEFAFPDLGGALEHLLEDCCPFRGDDKSV